MSPEDSYNKLKPSFANVVRETFIKANGLPAEVLTDGNMQIAVARIDQVVLLAEGMPATLIAQTEEALMAYSWIKGLADTAVAVMSGDQKRWEMTRDTGYEIRKQLFKYGKFGCDINGLTDVRQALDRIIEGRGDDDMVLDLLLCYQLFTANPNITRGLAMFTESWIESALEVHNELKIAQASVKNPKVVAEYDKLVLESRAAYTFYHNKVAELRSWGRFVFDGEPRADAYKAEYRTERYN